MGNTKIIPCGFGPVLVLVLLAGVVGGLGQWWADGGSQAVQLARWGALLAEAWEAAVVEEVLFRGVLLWACLSWARRRNEAYPRRAPRAAGKAVNKGAYATGRQIKRASGMFSAFKEEYDKARKEDD